MPHLDSEKKNNNELVIYSVLYKIKIKLDNMDKIQQNLAFALLKTYQNIGIEITFHQNNAFSLNQINKVN